MAFETIPATQEQQAAFAEQSAETMQETITRLAKLHPMEYDRMRIEEAKRLKCRPATLDSLVKTGRTDTATDESLVEQTEPYHSAVDLADVLNEIKAVFNRHAILPPHADIAMTLWCAFSWFIEAVYFAPLLIIRAPESECGKTTVKDIVELFVRRPLSSESVSNAAMFRVVEQEQPTLLLDDADSWLLRDPNDERHSLINSGHKRGGKVLRCVGDNHELKAFKTFCAKVLAFIGKSKDTLHNRSIEIVLRRKMAGERIQSLRNIDRSSVNLIRSKLARIEIDYSSVVASAKPSLPAGIDNRAADNWEPLLAIADIASVEWAELARKAALALNKDKEPVVSTGAELLADIQHIFENKGTNKIRTADLVQALCDDIEAGWQTYNHGRPISPRQVAKRLAEYSIRPKTIRFGYSDTPKGYELEQFQDAFARYLHTPPENGILSATTPQPSNHKALSVADNPPQNPSATRSATLEPASHNDCGGVADKTPLTQKCVRI
ncbi:MAG: DUF3631 domain-containing protein [Nitrosomonas sp.]|nr:DUF3631 domain-containing protein [Nitrosomonas sp.]